MHTLIGLVHEYNIKSICSIQRNIRYINTPSPLQIKLVTVMQDILGIYNLLRNI